MRRQRPVAFASPSLRLDELPDIASSVDLRGPLRASDLADVPKGTLIAVIDAFDGPSGTTDREITKAIARGVRMAGAAGIGACYAVKARDMRGVGEVYRMYVDGEIVSADEAAVVLDQRTGHARSEALVNVRFAVAQLVRSGSLTEGDGRAIVDAAVKLPATDRIYSKIFRAAGLGSKLDASQLETILRAIDLRREDAVTLLENLSVFDTDEDDASTRRVTSAQPRHRHVKKSTSADAPLVIWEYGEEISFHDLLYFAAASGRLVGYAKNALARSVLAGEAPPRSKNKDRGAVAQDLLDDISTAWGWLSSEELRGTLRELGFGVKEISNELYAEAASREGIQSLLRRLPTDLLKSLRFELLVNDLGLKREAMRLGSLQFLAQATTKEPSASEMREARKALVASALAHSGETTWSGLVASQGIPAAHADKIAGLVARARRRGVPLVESLENARAATGVEPKGINGFPLAEYASGSARSKRDDEVVEISKQIAKAIGISTIRQLTDTARISGIHVTAAYRPHQKSWDGAGSGKGETPEGATIGAIMEETEKYCQEMFTTESVVTRPFARWASSDVVDPEDLYLPNDSSYDSNRALQWGTATDLVSGREIHMPLAALVQRRVQDDPYFSKRMSKKYFSTNGLASGFSITEALHHGICERVERHAFKLAEQDLSNPGNLPGTGRTYAHIDLSTCPPSTRRICDALRTSGCLVRVIEITCEVSIPTYFATVFRPAKEGLDDGAQQIEFSGPGLCANSNPEVAINRAILEAVQTILVYFTDKADTVLQVRSLGRHMRPRPNGLGELARTIPWVPKRPYSTEGGFVGTCARDELAFLLRRLTAASFERVLYRDLSREETMPACVVRVYIPGMEDINPVHTGPRARARIVADLLHRHDW